TIKKKLTNCTYTNLREFCNDIGLVFENCYTYIRAMYVICAAVFSISISTVRSTSALSAVSHSTTNTSEKTMSLISPRNLYPDRNSAPQRTLSITCSRKTLITLKH
ncbi:MAG: bromodomain-containing protein, partial [Clostridiales bacterium]|nr:bromodomain-containing protein [Clostridiales bacterium]